MAKQKLRPDLVGIFDDLVPDGPPPVLPDIPKTREVPLALMMFWRKEQCERCKHTYEGSAYGSSLMLKQRVETPIVHFGRFFGWKYKGITYKHVMDVSCFDHLQREVEEIHSTIRNCPRCVHRPNVIYLGVSNG